MQSSLKTTPKIKFFYDKGLLLPSSMQSAFKRLSVLFENNNYTYASYIAY